MHTVIDAELEGLHSTLHTAITQQTAHQGTPPPEALRKVRIGQNNAHDVGMQIMEIPGSRTASKAELEAVHSPNHIDVMRRKALQDAPCVVADFEETPDNTTYMAKSSFDDALQARMTTGASL